MCYVITRPGTSSLQIKRKLAVDDVVRLNKQGCAITVVNEDRLISYVLSLKNKK